MGSIYLDWLDDVVDQAAKDTGYSWDHFDSNWLKRSRSSGGYDRLPLCVMWHHTAGGDNAWNDAQYQCNSADARPISNITVDSKVAIICAGGRTNTNGSGSNSPMSFSRGTVSQDNMNNEAVGIEICNNGVGAPYPEKQINFLIRLSNLINQKCGNKPTDVSTHQFYAPDRKVDPATASAVQGPWKPRSCTGSGSWDVNDLRNECKRRWEQGEDDDMPLSKEDIDKIAEAVWARPINTTGADSGIEAQPARYWLQRSFLIARQYLGGFSGKPAVDPSMLKQIHSETKKDK